MFIFQRVKIFIIFNYLNFVGFNIITLLYNGYEVLGDKVWVKLFNDVFYFGFRYKLIICGFYLVRLGL